MELCHNESVVDEAKVITFFRDRDIKFRLINIGENHADAITSDQKLYVWGSNNFGQTANPDYSDTEIPSQIKEFKDIDIDHVECGSNHTIIITDNGDVWVFGRNQYNQCTPSSKHQLWRPIKLNRLDMDTSNNSLLMGVIATCDDTFILTHNDNDIN